MACSRKDNSVVNHGMTRDAAFCQNSLFVSSAVPAVLPLNYCEWKFSAAHRVLEIGGKAVWLFFQDRDNISRRLFAGHWRRLVGESFARGRRSRTDGSRQSRQVTNTEERMLCRQFHYRSLWIVVVLYERLTCFQTLTGGQPNLPHEP